MSSKLPYIFRFKWHEKRFLGVVMGGGGGGEGVGTMSQRT